MFGEGGAPEHDPLVVPAGHDLAAGAFEVKVRRHVRADNEEHRDDRCRPHRER